MRSVLLFLFLFGVSFSSLFAYLPLEAPRGFAAYPLEENLEQAAERAARAAKEQNPLRRVLLESPSPRFGVFKRDGKVSPVLVREFLVTDASERKYMGTFGVATCIAVVLVGKKEGRVVKTGLAHVSAGCYLKASWRFFKPVLEAAEEVEVYLVASYGSEETALRVLEGLSLFAGAAGNPKMSYFVNLHGPNALIVNVEKGELYSGFDLAYSEVPKDVLRKNLRDDSWILFHHTPLIPSRSMAENYR